MTKREFLVINYKCVVLESEKDGPMELFDILQEVYVKSQSLIKIALRPDILFENIVGYNDSVPKLPTEREARMKIL